jgi:hypothetical protein
MTECRARTSGQSALDPVSPDALSQRSHSEGTPAIQTTVRYTQVSREQVKDKLKPFILKGP